MKRINVTNILDVLMEFSLLGVVFLIPVYFAFFLDNHNVFELNKLVLFKILTSLFLVCFLFRWSSSSSFISRDTFKRKSKYLLIPALVLLTLVLSTLLSRFPELSFWGSYTRQQGLVSFFYFFVFFVLSVFYINTSSQIRRILRVVGYSSFLVSLYGILQIVGWDWFSWAEPPQQTGRTISSLGQPNYLGSYLMLVIPVVVYLFYIVQKKGWRYFWAAVLVSNLVCLYFTGSRAAYVGLIVGAVFTALVYFFIVAPRQKIEKKKIILWTVTGILLCVVGGAALNYSTFSQRIATGFDLDQGSIAARWELWSASLDAIETFPWFGHGLETQREIFFQYYEKEWGLFSDADVIPNRAHNFILDKLLTTGVAGLLAYLALLYLFLKLIWQNIRKKDNNSEPGEKELSLAIMFALVSYLVSIFFHFEVIVTYVYFWLYLALLIVVHNKADSDKKKFILPSNSFLFRLTSGPTGFRRQKGIIFTAVKVVMILLLLSGFGLQLKRQLDYLMADHYYAYMGVAHAQDDHFRIFELYDYIEQLNIRTPHKYEREAVLMVSSFIDGNSPEYKEQGLEVIKDPLRELVRSSRFNDIYVRAQIYTALADQENKEYFELASKDYQWLTEKSPERSKHYMGYAKMWAKKGEYDKALENYKKALESLPSLEDPRINRDHSQTVRYKRYKIRKGEANIYFSRKEYQKAEEHYRLALKNNPSVITLYKKIADTYYKRNDLERAIEYNRKGYILNPRDASWPFSIALLYEKKGEEDEALQYGEQALELAPEDEQIKEFVEKLK